MTDPLALAPQQNQLVPAGYAEKAMASLMQLHSELMEEKERRVQLHTTLLQREQALAEMKHYVKMLEDKLASKAAPPVPSEPLAPPRVAAPPPPREPPQPPPLRPRTPVAAVARPPMPPSIAPKPRLEGWKTW